MINNNIMEKRINYFNILMYILFSLIIYRLIYLQVVNHNYYNELLNKKTIETIYEESPRGRIYDINNKLLVDNSLQMTIIYKNKNLSTKEEIDLAYKVYPYIDLNYQKLSESYLKDF